MYGLVNKAIEGLVISAHGEGAWERIRSRAGVGDEGFISMETYDDELTYRLVGAASEELGCPAEQILEAFGEYWTLYTAQEGYGAMFRSHGSSVREFLGNLNTMHARVESIYPDMVLPHFRTVEGAHGELLLHYSSQRPGLAPMVKGLVRGLAAMFGEHLSIDHIEKRADGAAEDVFVIRTLAG